ncbi:hypothetical protein NDU88_005581 [Pleurodeles waltl]|uniref:Uncharacterized protein n=1 Tax=Pleurodeles waltl TaxID=8319 RepID=A0AAV7LLV1_PLEWA|nr:hypothetical protein NDU88_005581 [Pleurodeles waltl]
MVRTALYETSNKADLEKLKAQLVPDLTLHSGFFRHSALQARLNNDLQRFAKSQKAVFWPNKAKVQQDPGIQALEFQGPALMLLSSYLVEEIR